jgi:hypothetical protein
LCNPEPDDATADASLASKVPRKNRSRPRAHVDDGLTRRIGWDFAGARGKQFAVRFPHTLGHHHNGSSLSIEIRIDGVRHPLDLPRSFGHENQVGPAESARSRSEPTTVPPHRFDESYIVDTRHRVQIETSGDNCVPQCGCCTQEPA